MRKEATMSNDVLVSQLKKVGWSGFDPGEFLGVQFDAIGKAKIARNNWFVLLKSIPELDTAGLETWSQHYAQFSKRARAGMFTSGKYFILLLLVDTLGADAVALLSEGFTPGFLEIPGVIDRGGGSTLLVIKDRKQVLMPKKVVLWDIVRATDFVRRTHQAVVDFVKRMGPAKGGAGQTPDSGSATVVAEKYDS
jgi:hypothetical protein